MPPSNDEESSDASGDASAISVGTRDAASTNGVPAEGSAAGGVYYVGGAMNGYAAHGYTVYDYPQGGWWWLYLLFCGIESAVCVDM